MYKRLVLAVLCVGLLLLPGAASAGVQDFVVDRFEADYFLSRDNRGVSDVTVREHIVATFPATDQNHGILRALPKSYQGHTLELKVNKVTGPLGSSWPYSTSTDENDNLVLKIGDANSYVHGQQTYDIEYTMRGVILKDGLDEFYWDVNGTGWQQPTGVVEARIHMSEDLNSAVRQSSCYTGVQGSTARECSIASLASTDNNGLRVVTARTNGEALEPGETLTFAIGFNKDTFAAYAPSTQQLISYVGQASTYAAPPIIAILVVWVNWRRFGRDPEGRGTIVPEYLPPKEASVLGSATVLNESLPASALSAQIVDLAVRHYLKIFELKVEKKFARDTKDYEIELVKDPSGLRTEERQVIDLLFKSPSVGQKVKISSLTTQLPLGAKRLESEMGNSMANQGFFSKAPQKAKNPYILWGTGLFVISFFWLPQLAGLTVAGLILFIFSFAMPARTRKGVELREYLLGLKDYIKLAEAERLKVLQGPHGQLTNKIDVGDKKQLVKLYEHLLPYAMIFGLEKEWAKVLAPLYDQEPSWYRGSSSFNAAYFASSFSGFSSASASAFAPASDSSSGGSGGGGSSGGGGGGGGGGGW